MENDPNKKESKGKRILRKALRRSSKSSNNSQSSVTDSVSVSRSKSFENKRLAVEINDSTPLPTPDGTKETAETGSDNSKTKTDNKTRPPTKQFVNRNGPSRETRLEKVVEIQEDHNVVYPSPEATSTSKDDKFNTFQQSVDQPLDIGGNKKSLKRKLEEESAAGTSGASPGASDTDADDKDPSKDKKKKNRCAVCRKKVGLTGFECRCGGLFCAVHRYSDKHDCSFDYRELGAQEIRRNNPVVVSQKIHKI